MTIPAGTQSNRLLRLRGKGMPKLKGGGSGDEYVRLIGTAAENLATKRRSSSKTCSEAAKRKKSSQADRQNR